GHGNGILASGFCQLTMGPSCMSQFPTALPPGLAFLL
ncbi:uncharacterized protein METZ01_LOCUS221126, partial [marine metagenome]